MATTVTIQTIEALVAYATMRDKFGKPLTHQPEPIRRATALLQHLQQITTLAD
jgi:hypothetical protein